MNDKEIEAIRLLNLCINSNIPLPEEALSWVKILLNLTGKLQKELEQEKEKNKLLKIEVENFDEASVLFIKDYCIYKQDIRNKIKELENIEQEDVDYSRIKFATIVLQELLEEE